MTWDSLEQQTYEERIDMMQERYSSDSVIERGYAIYDEWNNKKYNSRRIVNCVQTAVASSNAKKTPVSHATALSHLFALDLRIKERYDNIFKCIILYFSWHRETGALKTFKGMLKLPEGNDIRDVIEVELERLRQNIDDDKTDGTDKKNRGGKITEISGEEATAEKGEQQSKTTKEETLEEILDNEKSEEKEEKSTNIGEDKPIEDQAGESRAEAAEVHSREQVHNEAKKKTQENGEGFASVAEEEINQEKPYEQKTENNGFKNKNEPITDKKSENVVYNGAIDMPPDFEKRREDSAVNNVSFIDEVIMDNMIKGEKDIIGHNPLETVKREGEARIQVSDLLRGDKDNASDKDAHLYDKMVLNYKGEGLQNVPSTLQNESNTLKNESNAPQEKIQTVVNDKIDEARVQIKVEENLSEENVFRRSVNDKYNNKMIHLHKALMEEALREDLRIIDLGLDDPLRFIEESNIKEYQSKIALGKKH